MKILVVGGAGYIGSVVTAHLIRAGHQVTVADNLVRGHRDAVPDTAIFNKIDITDQKALHRLLSRGFDGVMHFAALSLVSESNMEPVRYFKVNVGGSLNLLDAMAEANVKRLVFSSTAAVYGEPHELPISEDCPTKPSNAYGASKLAIDQAITFECAARGLAATSLRYFNVSGASGDLGERHNPESHLIPLVLHAAAKRRKTLQIFGTDYPTPDGTAIRDYIHVEDLARAHLLAIEATHAGIHRIYNLGNGTGFSVREVIECASDITGVSIPWTSAARRDGDPAILVASSDRIRDELGWIAEKPALAEMVRDAWRLIQKTSHDLSTSA